MENFLASMHPIVVHFPIGLLTVYAVLTLIPLRLLSEDPRWILAKRVLLFFGTLGILVAFQTGEQRGGENFEPGTILAFHSLFAEISIWIFSIIAGAEFVIVANKFVSRLVTRREGLYVAWKVIEKIARIIAMRPVAMALALLGLMALMTTGALGGGMVYGADADPMVSIITKLLKIQ